MQLKWPMRWDLFSLFPAYAGVILVEQVKALSDAAFPRIRGGDPRIGRNMMQALVFSPHTRG